MTFYELTIIRDYLRHSIRVLNIDSSVGYKDGTLLEAIISIDKELSMVKVEFESGKVVK